MVTILQLSAIERSITILDIGTFASNIVIRSLLNISRVPIGINNSSLYLGDSLSKISSMMIQFFDRLQIGNSSSDGTLLVVINNRFAVIFEYTES